MSEPHYKTCEAAICQCDPNPNNKNEVIWRPGEGVCMKSPFEKFQKKQIEINKLVKKGTFKNMDEGYTANQLETMSI